LNGSGPKAAAALPPVQYGDANRGFEILVNKHDRVVRLKLHGIWDVGTAQAFCSAILSIAKELTTGPWGILADSRAFPAQSPDVARLRQETMARVRKLGCRKIASVASSAVYTMQFTRIAEDNHGASRVFPDVKAAIEWLLEGRDEETRNHPVSSVRPIDGRPNRRHR
jgi:hypothetical protein